jgi:hypothetical protein
LTTHSRENAHNIFFDCFTNNQIFSPDTSLETELEELDGMGIEDDATALDELGLSVVVVVFVVGLLFPNALEDCWPQVKSTSSNCSTRKVKLNFKSIFPGIRKY